MSWVKKNKLFLLLLILLTALAVKPYLSPKFPYTHDGENHLARFANYKVAVKEGQIPPRFAPNLINHYGYPVFNYNYPLANILSLPFSILKINYEWTFKIIVAGFLMSGIIGVKHWLKTLGMGKSGQFFGMSLFATSPYLISTLAFRGNIGEVMTLCLLPWLFYFIDREIHNFKQSKIINRASVLTMTVIWTMFFLSHNVTVLFGTPLLIIYALLKHGKKISSKFSLWVSFILGILLSMWFWIPAIFEKNLIILDNADLSKDFIEHFPTVNQLLFSPLEFGFSKLGSVDSLSFALGLIQIIVLIMAVILLVKKQLILPFKVLLSLVVVTIIFQLGFTKGIWQIIPLTNFIQFPWRLTLFFSILILPLGGLIFTKAHFYFKFFLIFILGIQIVGILKIKPADYFHKTIVDYDAFSQTTTTTNENLPKNFTYKNFAQWQPSATIIEGEGEVIVEEWRGSVRRYNLLLTQDSTIVEPTANFAGWKTGYWLEGSDRPAVLAEYIDSEEIGGRLAYKLPAGNYQIHSEFTNNTLPRFIGHLVSALGLAILSALLLIPQKKYAK